MFSKLFILVAALLFTVSNAGTAYLINRCDYDIWIFTENGAPGGGAGPIHVPKRTKHQEPVQKPACEGCGFSFKASKTTECLPGFHTQFEYSINMTAVGGPTLYYDLSYVDCAVKMTTAEIASEGPQAAKNCPGWTEGHTISSPNKACTPTVCAPGTFCPKAAYYIDEPNKRWGDPYQEPVFGCGKGGIDMDLHFVMCSGQSAIPRRSIAGRVQVEDWLDDWDRT